MPLQPHNSEIGSPRHACMCSHSRMHISRDLRTVSLQTHNSEIVSPRCHLAQFHEKGATTLREVFLARTHKSTTPFPHDAAVLRIVSGVVGAFQRYLARPPTRRRWRTAPSDVLSEAPPSGPSSHVATRDLMSPLVTPSCTIELCDLCGRRCLQRCCSWSIRAA